MSLSDHRLKPTSPLMRRFMKNVAAVLLCITSAAYAQTTYTPNPFGGEGTFHGPGGTTTYTPNPFGGGGSFSRP